MKKQDKFFLKKTKVEGVWQIAVLTPKDFPDTDDNSSDSRIEKLAEFLSGYFINDSCLSRGAYNWHIDGHEHITKNGYTLLMLPSGGTHFSHQVEKCNCTLKCYSLVFHAGRFETHNCKSNVIGKPWVCYLIKNNVIHRAHKPATYTYSPPRPMTRLRLDEKKNNYFKKYLTIN